MDHLQHTTQLGPLGRFLRECIDHKMELHRRAKNALEQGVVEFLSYPKAFGKTLFESGLKTYSYLTKVKGLNAGDDQRPRKRP